MGRGARPSTRRSSSSPTTSASRWSSSDTTFHFVTDGIESALAQAKEAAGGQDVLLGGGADAARQYLAAGLVDEMQLSLVPILLGGGERLFEGVDPALGFEQVGAVEAPGVTHLTYAQR